jgi:hypothetical protein
LLLQKALLAEADLKEQNALIEYTNEILNLTGLLDLREFRTANAQQLSTTCENFILRVEMLRRGLQFSQLDKAQTTFRDIYPYGSCSQNCGGIRFLMEISECIQ